MSYDESQDHQGVVSESMEFRVSKRKDDGEHRATDVTKEDREERRNLPVLANAYDDVEVLP
jgi:predicted kinase